MQPLMPLEHLTLALAAVDTRGRKGWATKARIVALIGRWPAGVAVSRDTLAWWLCSTAQGHVGALLRELVEERVLLLEAPAAGSRPATYRVNPELEQWREVPWRREPRWVIASMFHGEQGPADNGTPGRPVYTPADNGGLYGWYVHQPTRVGVVGRSVHQPTTGGAVGRSVHQPTRVPGAVRSVHQPTTGPDGGRSMHQPTTGDGALVVPPPGVDAELSSSSSWGPEEEQRELRRVSERDAACEAIRRRVGAGFMRGAPRARAVGLVDAYGLQAVLDAIRAEAPGSAQVPAYVDRLAGRLASDAHGVDLDDLGPADEAPVAHEPVRELREYDRYVPDTDPGPTAEERAQAAERAAAAREALAASLSGATIPVAEGGETP